MEGDEEEDFLWGWWWEKWFEVVDLQITQHRYETCGQSQRASQRYVLYTIAEPGDPIVWKVVI